MRFIKTKSLYFRCPENKLHEGKLFASRPKCGPLDEVYRCKNVKEVFFEKEDIVELQEGYTKYYDGTRYYIYDEPKIRKAITAKAGEGTFVLYSKHLTWYYSTSAHPTINEESICPDQKRILIASLAKEDLDLCKRNTKEIQALNAYRTAENNAAFTNSFMLGILEELCAKYGFKIRDAINSNKKEIKFEEQTFCNTVYTMLEESFVRELKENGLTVQLTKQPTWSSRMPFHKICTTGEIRLSSTVKKE